MRLDDIDPSGNINDQGSGGGGFGGGGGGGIIGLLFGLLPMLLGRKLGCGTLLVIAVIGYFVMSSGMLNLGGSGVAPGQSAQQGAGGSQACDTESELYACRVFTSTETTWTQIFKDAGGQYQPAKLEFYQSGGQSGCGAAQSAMGAILLPL